MKYELITNAFKSGELSPDLYARVDVAAYPHAAKTVRNFLIRPGGGLDNRTGFGFVAAARDEDHAVRLVPFEASENDTFMIEFGEGYIRFFSGGGLLKADGHAGWDAGVSYAAGTYVTYNDVRYLSLKSGNLNKQPDAETAWWQGNLWDGGTAYAADAYVRYDGVSYRSLDDGNTGNQPDTHPGEWEQVSDYVLSSPYTEDDLGNLRVSQSADVMTIVAPGHPVRELRRYANLDWRLVDVETQNGPFDALNADLANQMYASAETGGNVTIKTLKDTFSLSDVGRLIRLEEHDHATEKMWEVEESTNRGELVRVSERVYRAVSSGETGSVRPVHTKGTKPDSARDSGRVYWTYLHSGFGIARITEVVSATEVKTKVLTRLPSSVVGGTPLFASNTFNLTGNGTNTMFNINGASSDEAQLYEVRVDGIVQAPYEDYDVEINYDFDNHDRIVFVEAPADGVPVVVKEYTYVNRSPNWQLGEWSDTTGYPDSVTFFGDRRIFGKSEQVHLSRVGAYDDFLQSNPILDDDGISERLSSRKVNEIVDLVPLTQLLLLTRSGVWVVSAGQDNVLTPSTIAFRQQSYFGAEDLPAEVIGSTAIYVQAGGRILRELKYTLEQDGYSGQDLTLISNHLFKHRTVKAMAFQAEPSILWVVMSDGALLTLTYLPEQRVIGWARHDTDGAFEHVAALREAGEDVIYAVVRRTIDGTERRFVERMASRTFSETEDGHFLDSFLTYDGRMTGDLSLSGSAWMAEDLVTLSQSLDEFEASHVGDMISMEHDGETVRFTISEIVSGTEAIAVAEQDVPAGLQNQTVSAWCFHKNHFEGLDHLEGKTVGVMGDGYDLGTAETVVSGGAVDLPEPACRATIGLSYQSDLQTLDVFQAGDQLARGRPKAIPRVSVVVREARDLLVGDSEAGLLRSKVEAIADYEDVANPIAGLIEVATQTRYGLGGSVLVRHDRPLGCTVLAVMPEIDFGGR